MVGLVGPPRTETTVDPFAPPSSFATCDQVVAARPRDFLAEELGQKVEEGLVAQVATTTQGTGQDMRGMPAFLLGVGVGALGVLLMRLWRRKKRPSRQLVGLLDAIGDTKTVRLDSLSTVLGHEVKLGGWRLRRGGAV